MYFIIKGALYLLSLLPMKVLYLIGDMVYGLVFYIFKYRKHIVKANMRQAFPEKAELEINLLCKKFYHNLIDCFVEIIKLFSTNKKFIYEMCESDVTIPNQLFAEGKSFQLHAAHQFNWEVINHFFSLSINGITLGIYMPLTNKAMDKLFLEMRQRYKKTVMLPATNMKNEFVAWRNKLHMLVLVADQNPGGADNGHWLNFLGKPAPFIKGPERYAREKAIPVVFARVLKIKRGKYQVVFEKICDDASTLAPLELTKKFRDFIEAAIREQPENWLWTHRRWKHEWKPAYGEVL